MALRKPLVIVAGQIEQLQSGDTLTGPFAEIESVSVTNGEASPITIGQVVYISAADTVKKARADATATQKAFALVQDASIAAAAIGQVQTSGVLGGMSGLVAGSEYFLDPTTAGAITTVAPTTVGQYVMKLGRALSTTEFDINISIHSVLL